MILSMFERYTPSARQVVAHANEEARSLRHGALGVEHLLLGILLDDVGHGGRALRGLGLTADGVRARLAELVPPGAPTAGAIPFTPRAQQVITRADAESLGLGHERVGTEHLLLAIAREPDGLAVRILGEQHLGAEAVRDAVRRALEEVVEPPLSAPAAAPAPLRRTQPFAAREGGIAALGVPLAPDARRAIGRALAAALADGRDELTADDLRAGLLSSD
jgi:ATP-dependent Clp protease ATP-binding subunit ClpC